MRQRLVLAAAGSFVGLHIAANVFSSALSLRDSQQVGDDTEQGNSVLEVCKRVLTSDCGIKPGNVTVVFVNSFSSFSMGWPYRKNGAVIGLSRTYLLTGVSAEDVKRFPSVVYCGKTVDWKSEEGKSLSPLFLPNEEELLFTIAHEAGHLKKQHFLAHSLLAPAFFAVTCRFVSRMKVGNRRLEIMMKTSASCLSFVTFLLFRSIISQMQEYQADRYAAKLSAVHAAGGIKAMKKKLELLPEDDKTDSRVWSIVGRLWQTHPPLHKRLAKLEKLVN